MPAWTKTLSLQLAIADDDGISLSQTPAGAGNLTITGALAAGGVATMDVARRVLLTFAADETGHTFTIYGTDRNGAAQSEVKAGTTAGVVYTAKDFKTVTRVAISAAATGAIKVGTNAIGSTAPMIVDFIANPNLLQAQMDIQGTATASLEKSLDDLAPEWDLATNSPQWAADANFTGIAADKTATVQGPMTMLRLTITAGTDPVVVKVITPFGAGRF